VAKNIAYHRSDRASHRKDRLSPLLRRLSLLRRFGLDVGDWSLLLVGVALAALILTSI
jgi:hypothetical protein